MKRPKAGERSKRTAVYLAPAAYGEAVDLERALAACKQYIRTHSGLWLTRIYRDERVEVMGHTVGQHGTECRTPLSAAGNDAWMRLLVDLETAAVEAVVLYAARTVAPTISGLKTMLREFFLPCGIRYVDVEAGFDTAAGAAAADDYCRARTREYRSTVRRSACAGRTGEGGATGKPWADGTK